MASAVLASRNEPCYGERRVYMRKTPVSNLNPNPSYGLARDHVYDYPNPNGACAMNLGERSATAVLDDCSSFNLHPPPSPVPTAHGDGSWIGGYVRFNISGYSRRELRDLKRRLVSELKQVRSVTSRIDSLSPSSSRISHREAESPVSGRTRPGSEELRTAMMKRCGGVLTKLMKHKGGVWFNAPVDVEALGLRDYHQIIRSPMDLGTIKAKLTKGMYGTPLKFASDIRLTFNNALRYNPQGHEVNKLAGQLLRLFESLFQPAYVKYEKQQKAIAREERVVEEERSQQRNTSPCPQASLPESVPRTEPKRAEVEPLAARAEPTRPELEPLAPTRVHPSGYAQVPQPQQPGVVGMGRGVVGRLPKPKANDQNKRAMSFEEKHKLSIGLQSLPPEKMDQVVRIVRRRNGVPAPEGDEIELDIEVMDKETLWELDRFLCSCKKVMSKKRRQEVLSGLGSCVLPSDPSPIPIEGGDKSPMAGEMPEVRKNKRGETGDEDVDIGGGDDLPCTNYPPVEIDKDVRGSYVSRSSSSGSSSSSSSSSSSGDSNSGSSSDSDSDKDDAVG